MCSTVTLVIFLGADFYFLTALFYGQHVLVVGVLGLSAICKLFLGCGFLFTSGLIIGLIEWFQRFVILTQFNVISCTAKILQLSIQKKKKKLYWDEIVIYFLHEHMQAENTELVYD